MVELLENKIKKSIVEAFRALFEAELDVDSFQLQPTRKEFEGSHTFVMFPYLRMTKKNPEQSGTAVGDYLKEHSAVIANYNVVKGFLNLTITESEWMSFFETIFKDDTYGQLPANNQKVMVEYSSPNTNKPLHLGHMRNNFLGFSVSQILSANGYEVQKVNLVNDRGIHICKSMVAYQKFGKEETPEESGIKGDHLAGKYYVAFDKAYKKEIDDLVQSGKSKEEAEKQAPIMQEARLMLQKWEDNDPEVLALWKKMNGWVYLGFEETYKKMGVSFDKFYYESDTYLSGKDIVEEGLKKEILFKKDDGSAWIDLAPDGLDEKLLLRGDGTSVYMTQDLGTADIKYNDFAFDKSVYVVGNEQDYHFKVLFKILEKLGRPYAMGMYHLSYGMVDLPTGKMKSREGTVVDADDLMQEMIDTAREHTSALGKIDGFSEKEAEELYETLGMGALKYFLLKVDPKKRMLFDPKESIEFQGNTGPFIQYTHARISAILRKSDDMGLDWKSGNFIEASGLAETTKSLIITLTDYVSKIRQAGEEMSPSVIAQYIYDLAKEYNRFYQEVPILAAKSDKEKCFNVQVSYVTARTIKSAMLLLGIEAPERM